MLNKNILQIIVLLILAGLVKGGLHVVRIIVLAGLGLAGMWMLHQLAQDYDKISNKFMFGSINPSKSLQKREVGIESDISGVSPI